MKQKKSNQFKKDKKNLIAISKWYKPNKMFHKKIEELVYRSIKPHFFGQSVLEMGSADGVLTQYLIKHFRQTTCIDASPIYMKKIRKKFPQVLVEETLFETYKPTKQFDTIIMDHVLEHIRHPTNMLRKIKSWLPSKGKLIIIVPNAHSIHRLLGVQMGMLKKPTQLNQKDKKLGHCRVYTPTTLKKIISQAGGYKILEFSGILFKPLSNSQVEKFPKKVVEGFFELGKQFPQHCSELLVVLTHE